MANRLTVSPKLVSTKGACNEGLPGVSKEEENKTFFAIGTQKQSRKIIGNM